jgi:hypothetical protein
MSVSVQVSRAAVAPFLGLVVIGGCGGKASPAPVGEQLRDALQEAVVVADASARVSVCGGPQDGGPGRYVCSVRWPRGGGPPVFQVYVDRHGGWRTDQLPHTAALGGEPMGSINGRGLRVR